MDAAGTGGTALQADGAAPRPLPLIVAGAAATGGAESVGGGGAVAVADGLLEPPASRLVSPWAKCSPLSLFADASGSLSLTALQRSCKLFAVPTEMAEGNSHHQDAQLDLGRVRSIVVEYALLETFTSSQSAAVDVFGVQERVAAVRPISDRVPKVTALLKHCALDFAICPCDDDDRSYTLMGSAEKIPLARWVGRVGFVLFVTTAPLYRSNPLPPKPGWAFPYPYSPLRGAYVSSCPYAQLTRHLHVPCGSS